MLKINSFRGDLIDISALKEALEAVSMCQGQSESANFYELSVEVWETAASQGEQSHCHSTYFDPENILLDHENI